MDALRSQSRNSVPDHSRIGFGLEDVFGLFEQAQGIHDLEPGADGHTRLPALHGLDGALAEVCKLRQIKLGHSPGLSGNAQPLTLFGEFVLGNDGKRFLCHNGLNILFFYQLRLIFHLLTDLIAA